MFNYSLKPLSPHLTIYSIQNSSLSSILHRITGIIFLVVFFYTFYFYLNSFNLYLIKYTLFSKLFYLAFIFFKIFFEIFIVFHILNGVKFALWSFNYLTQLHLLFKINQILFGTLFIAFILI